MPTCMKDSATHKSRWVVRKFADDAAFKADKPFSERSISDNILLNEGIGEMWDLVCGLGTPTEFNNANAQLGVGTSATAEDATQTDLLANGVWKGMETGYPSRSGETVTFRAVFGSTEANQVWAELSVRNGATADKNMNRKVSDQGTKAAGQTWTLDLQITPVMILQSIAEGSTGYLMVSFVDKDGNPAAPSTAAYRIDCLTTKEAIRAKTVIAAAETIEIKLDPSDNAIRDQINGSELRLVTVMATYGPADAVNSDYKYVVRNLRHVP